MSRDSLVEKYNERHEGVDYFYTTCHNNGCWDATCLIKCGIKDGKVVSIEPDDSVNAGIAREDDDENAVQTGMLQARACPMGHAWRQELYSENRLLYPMKRVGEKGSGRGHFERISWDEALDTIAEYRADLEKKMQEAADAQAEEAARQTLVDSVVRAAECDVPAPMVEEKLDDMMQQMGWRMQQQGFSMEQYLKLIGQTEQQMRDMYRSEALNNVKTELVIDEIIKAENIEATDEDVNKLLEGYTTAMNQTVEQLRESFSEEQLDFFKHRASMNKALDLLWDNAKVTDEDADAKPEAKAGDGEAAAPAEA